MITYRKATADDIRPALDLALRVFMEFEAAEYEPEAIPRFKADIINNEVAIQNWTCGKNSMHVACDGDQIVGVIGEKWGNGHINIVFVEGQYHRRGIATELMNHIICDLKLRGFDKITLFSSPYGLLFYRQYGFVPTDVEQHSDGFIFTPMEYIQTRYGMPSTKTEIKQGVTLSEAGKWRPEIITSLFMCGSTTAGANG